MLLGEPPRTPYDLNFSLFGIPVRVHPLFWLVTLVLGAQSRDVASVLTWVVAVFISILVHELGHAAVMRAYGFRPWITLYGLGGLASYDQGRTYGSKGAEPLGQILMSLAGPAAGFLLAATLLAGLVPTGYWQQIDFVSPFGLRPKVVGLDNDRLAGLVNDMFRICVLWGLVNLLPIYPLDGGQVAREILQKLNGSAGIRQSLMLSMLAAGMMAAYGLLHRQEQPDWFIALFFGYMAYSSYAALQAYSNRGPWP